MKNNIYSIKKTSDEVHKISRLYDFLYQRLNLLFQTRHCWRIQPLDFILFTTTLFFLSDADRAVFIFKRQEKLLYIFRDYSFRLTAYNQSNMNI